MAITRPKGIVDAHITKKLKNTSQQANKQTNKLINKHTNKQANEQTRQQVNKQTNKQMDIFVTIITNCVSHKNLLPLTTLPIVI